MLTTEVGITNVNIFEIAELIGKASQKAQHLLRFLFLLWKGEINMQKAQAAKRMWDSMAAGFAQRPLLDEENSFTMQLSHTQKDVLQAFLRERAKDSVLEEETVTTVTAIYCNVNK